MKISKEKIQKISEQILFFLYSNNPRSFFTSHIAKELARDEEFIKNLLIDLHKKNLILKIDKNPLGNKYLRRIRWKLSSEAYQYYKKNQI